jgi:glutamate synthase (NADPH/NADH) large chain
LRKRFRGKADFVENYFRFVAAEVREYLAELGFRSFDEIVGRSDLLERNESISHWKTKNLDLSDLTAFSRLQAKTNALFRTEEQHHKIEGVLDHELIRQSAAAIEKQEEQ